MEKLPVLEKEPKEKFKSQIEIIKGENGDLADLLITDGAKQVSLKEFLPSGIKFDLENSIFSYSHKDKKIRCDPERFNTLGGRLALLHEIGHAIDFSKNPELEKIAEGDVSKQIGEIRLAFITSWKYINLPDEESRKAYLLEELAREIRKSDIPEDRLAEFIKSIASIERMGWAEALKLYRKIKKDGDLDLLEGAKTKNIIGWLEQASLGIYDKVYGELLPEQQFKLFLIKKFGGEVEEAKQTHN